MHPVLMGSDSLPEKQGVHVLRSHSCHIPLHH